MRPCAYIHDAYTALLHVGDAGQVLVAVPVSIPSFNHPSPASFIKAMSFLDVELSTQLRTSLALPSQSTRSPELYPPIVHSGCP